MRNVSLDYIERYAGQSRDRPARARHDQPAIPLDAPEETLVCCGCRQCRRVVRVVLVPETQRYFCPYCDARLEVAELDGGERA